MRAREKAFGVLCITTLMLVHSGGAAMSSGESQDLAWPAAFGDPGTAMSDWVTHEVDAGTLRLRMSLPRQWTVKSGRAAEEMLLTAQDSAQAMRLDIEPLAASGFQLDAPLSNASVQGTIGSIQANVGPRGHEIVGAGQVRSGKRIWLWHESRMKPAAFETGPYAGGRAWIFTGTPQSQRMTIYASVLYERNTSAADMDGKTRRAGAIFTGFLERLSLERR